jgi:AraC family transcriptional regulator of adaptative response / DNA-3-methyladenine glycosylase II
VSELRLAARAPFDAAGMLAHLAARAVPGVEAIEGGEYRRALRLPHGAAVAGLAPDDGDGGVRLRLWGADPRDRDGAVRRCAALLDLAMDPAEVLGVLGEAPVVGPLVRARPGLRLPGTTDPAELAVRAVIGQQVSVAGAATVAGRLAREHGVRLATPVGLVTHAFPAPEALAAADPATLPMPRARGRAIVGLAAAIATGDVDLRPGADPERAGAQLLALPGIGPWTADYVRMRALGDPDVLLDTDLGVRAAAAEFDIDLRSGRPDWAPWRSYATHHLWASHPVKETP